MRDTHNNSINALKTLNKEKRKEEILSIFEHENIPRTRRQIKEELGYEDMDDVSPRVTELLQSGDLEEAGSTFDFKTGKTVMLVKIKEMQLSLIC